MSTSEQTNAGRERAPGTVAIDAELANRLVAALEMIGAAFTLDAVNDGHRVGNRGGGSGGPPDPLRARAARDYDVLRGLLGRPGAPRPLRMHRDPKGHALRVYDKFPASARSVAVESPGDGASDPITERFNINGDVDYLQLKKIQPAMLISRVEVFDQHHALVAFGPSIAPIR